MKQFALLCLAAVAILCPVTAQADWTENFDSYALGSSMHGQGGWEGWLGDPNATAYVTDAQAYSTPHSVEITGASDLVHPYDGYVMGQWVYTAWQYIPTEFSGTTYFLLLNTYVGTQNWSTQVSFNSSGQYIQNDGTGDQLPMITGRWVEIRVEIDLDADTQTFYYDNQMLFSSSWTEGISGGGALNIGCVDLYANASTPVYYDDISLLPAGGVPAEETSWGGVKSLFR